MTDDEVLVLLRADPTRKQHVAKNSVIITAHCGHQSWISPSGLAYHLHNPTVRTSCERCMPPLAENTPVGEIPGSMDEIRAELGPAAANRIADWLRHRPQF